MRITKKQAKIIFKAGMLCQKLHPDDDSYDSIRLEDALKRANKLNKKKNANT